MMRKSSLTLSMLLVVFVPVLLLSTETAAAADELFKATTAVSLPGAQSVISFDISYVDPVIGLYVLADRTNNAIDVVDTFTNTVLVQLGKGQFAGPASCNKTGAGANDCAGPDGVVIVGHREAWVGDGPRVDTNGNVTVLSTVKVINLFSEQVTHTISTGGQRRSDELCDDPRDHRVLVANNADDPPYVTLISTKTYQVLKQIKFDGTNGTPKATNGIEQCQWSHRTGKFYVAVPEVNGPGDNTAPGGVAVINPITGTVERTFIIPINSCAGPQGMAIGPEHQILLGCNSPGPTPNAPTAIINERNGHVIATLNNESGADMVWFNPGDNHYFLARSSAVGTSQLLGVVDADDPHEDQSVFTATKVTPARNAHSVAADPIFNQVYVPIPAQRSTVCSSAGGDDTKGCIAVFTGKKDKDDASDEEGNGGRGND